jgi:hypothetical protein
MEYLPAGMQVDHDAIQHVLVHLMGEAWNFHLGLRGRDDLIVFEDR